MSTDTTRPSARTIETLAAELYADWSHEQTQQGVRAATIPSWDQLSEGDRHTYIQRAKDHLDPGRSITEQRVRVDERRTVAAEIAALIETDDEGCDCVCAAKARERAAQIARDAMAAPVSPTEVPA